jgi:hypothetical protein
LHEAQVRSGRRRNPFVARQIPPSIGSETAT